MQAWLLNRVFIHFLVCRVGTKGLLKLQTDHRGPNSMFMCVHIEK